MHQESSQAHLREIARRESHPRLAGLLGDFSTSRRAVRSPLSASPATAARRLYYLLPPSQIIPTYQIPTDLNGIPTLFDRREYRYS